MKKELDLGTEKISKLIKRFAIPCVISMIVAALYNIVDQIFIGWSSAGAFGNAATNIVYPFTVISLAFALLIGDGAAALFSLSEGAKDKEKASKSIGNALTIGNKTLTWMNGRELSTYSDGTNNISYKYNFNGIRTSKAINNITTNYYVEGRNIIFEDRNGTMLYYLYNGDELLGFIYNNNTYYYHKNLFQDIIGIYDSNYNEIVTYDYDSWGVIKNITDNSNINLGTINPFRYRSYYYDTETELYYLNSRYYNPIIGRFINLDAYVSTGQKLTGHNMFCYCGNNPVMDKDNGKMIVFQVIKTMKAVANAYNQLQDFQEAKKKLQGKTQNCYAYATNISDHTVEPGEYWRSHKSNDDSDIFELGDQFTLYDLTYLIMKDLEYAGKNLRIISGPDEEISSDEYLIAFRMTEKYPSFLRDDYHVMVRKDDGYWYEKKGLEPPRKIGKKPKWSDRMNSKTVYLAISK